MSNTQNISRSLFLNRPHTKRYDMRELRFKGGASVGLAPVGHHKLAGIMTGKILPRGTDARHQKLENRRQHQHKKESVRLIHDRPYQ